MGLLAPVLADLLEEEGMSYEYDDHIGIVRIWHTASGYQFQTRYSWISRADLRYVGNWLRKVKRDNNLDNLQSPGTGGRESTMLESLIRMYNAAMRMNVRSLIPHLVGPPGVGKSEVMYQLAQHAQSQLHVLNVARLSPLEIEGVQMPHGEGDNMKLKMLHNTMWMNLKEGDIVLFDEFLRGFPEVYNGLLDIITSREVAGYKLPKVFFVAASNSVATYDKALEDRLLHIMVPDIRSSMGARNDAKKRLVEQIGLLPEVIKTQEMDELFQNIVMPTYKMLDFFKGKASLGQVADSEGFSCRHLTGEAHLREVRTAELKALITLSNQLAVNQRKWQYVVLIDAKNVDPQYVSGARKLIGNPQLTEIQANNLALNLDLIEIEEALKETLTATVEEDMSNDSDIF